MKELVKEKTEEGVLIGAICAGPMVLGGLGLLKGKRATCFPFFEPTMVGATPTDNGVEQDGNIITSKGPGFMFEFGLTILRNLKVRKSLWKWRMPYYMTLCCMGQSINVLKLKSLERMSLRHSLKGFLL